MQLFIQPVVNVFQTAAYFFINEKTKHGFLIDPGAEGDKLLQKIREKGWHIDKVILTHGHFDHSYQAAKVADTLGIECVVNENAVNFMRNDKLNLSVRYHQHVLWPKKVKLVSDHTLIKSNDGSFSLEAIATPGHTPDSQILYSKQYGFALVGDMIYNENVGLTQFPDGDKAQILDSLSKKVATLPDETELLNGHTAPMNVGKLKIILAQDYGIRV